MLNLNLLFNKSYFETLKIKDGKSTVNLDALNSQFKEWNNIICDAIFTEKDYGIPEQNKEFYNQLYTHTFLMKTTYPGLLVGTGYAHETGDGSADCVKLGFSFDYVTGQPYVPGSSVKGMLRSCFQPDVIGELMRAIQANPEEYQIKEDDLLDVRQIDYIMEHLQKLEANIFDGRDIFFDAVLRCGCMIRSDEKGKRGNVMALDFITPHGKDITKNPTPLMMVKVLPNVIFEFRFHLEESIIGDVKISVQQKIALFQILIELFGVGAKTNVGYGALLKSSEAEAIQQMEQIKQYLEEHRQSAAYSTAPQHTENPQHAHIIRSQSAQQFTSAPAQDGERKPCPGKGCTFMIQSRFSLCKSCRDKARKDGICAVCGAPTGVHPGRGDHFEFCKKCKGVYDP